MKTFARALVFFGVLVFGDLITASALGHQSQSDEARPRLPTVVRKSGGVLEQTAIKRVEPVYPPQALSERASGPVVVEITTDVDGAVVDARAISGHILLKEAAVEAARGWTFVPTKLSGVPIKVIGTITFNFTLGTSASLDKEIEHYEKKVKENSKSSHAHLGLGHAYIKAKRNQEAIDAFTNAINLDPDLAEGHYQLGAAYLDQGRPEQAVAPFKRTVELNPKHGMAHHGLGETYSRLGREEDAIVEFKEALRHDPDNTETHFLLGHMYFRTGKYREAIRELKQVRPIEPFRSNVHMWMGLSYHKLGDKEAAMREHKTLEMINKSAAEYLMKEMNK